MDWTDTARIKPTTKRKYQCLAIRSHGEIIVNPNPDHALEADITLLIIVNQKDIQKDRTISVLVIYRHIAFNQL